jgi:hypothetical protein
MALPFTLCFYTEYSSSQDKRYSETVQGANENFLAVKRKNGIITDYRESTIYKWKVRTYT